MVAQVEGYVWMWRRRLAAAGEGGGGGGIIGARPSPRVGLVVEEKGHYCIDYLLQGALYKMVRNMVVTAIAAIDRNHCPPPRAIIISMNDREVLKDWHRRRLNETLGEHDIRMESSPPRNIHAVLHRGNERDDSAMLPTSLSSSNGGRENTVGTMRGGNVVGTTAPTMGGRIVSAPPQNSWIEGSAASASNVADGRVVVENIPAGVAVAGMSAVMGGVDVERVVTTTVAVVLNVLEEKEVHSLLAMPLVKGTSLFCWRRIW